MKKFCFYANPEATGWLGWIEDESGAAIAFVGLDGVLLEHWD